MNRILLRMTAAADGSPKWQKIFVQGEFHRGDMPGGVVHATTEKFVEMIANWKKGGGNGLPVDQFHWGDSNDTRIRAEDKKAKGWLEDFRIAEDGDLEALVKWNEDGAADINADRLRYFSPSFHPAWPDKSTGKPQGWTLFGGGLLNDPYLTELPKMTASLNPQTNAQPGAEHPTMKILMKKLIDALNASGIKLAHDALEPEVVTAFETYVANVLKGDVEHVEVVKLNATMKPLVDGLEPLKMQLVEKSAEVVNLTAKLVAAETEKVKATAAARDAAIELAFDKMLTAHEVLPAKKAAFTKIALAIGIPEAVAAMGGTKIVPAGELGTGGSADVGGKDEAKLKLTALAAEHVKANPSVKMSEALRAVQSKHPDLTAQANAASKN